MSFWDKASKAASSAAEATKKAAQSAADSAKATYADLKAAPSTVLCTKCNVDIPVPENAWTWTCDSNKHINSWDATACTQCAFPRPKDLPNPSIHCAACSSVIVLPSSNFTKHFREGGQKTATFVKTTAASTKAYVEHQAATPDTFHCSHCDALLAVPTGVWACQTCTAMNAEDNKVCEKCSQKKSDQKAICGVCGQSTKIPTSNFADSVSHTTRDLSSSTKKLYYDVSGKAYTTCPQCKTHISVKAPNKTGSDQSAPTGENASAAVLAEGAGSDSGHVECPSCKFKFDRQ